MCSNVVKASECRYHAARKWGIQGLKTGWYLGKGTSRILLSLMSPAPGDRERQRRWFQLACKHPEQKLKASLVISSYKIPRSLKQKSKWFFNRPLVCKQSTIQVRNSSQQASRSSTKKIHTPDKVPVRCSLFHTSCVDSLGLLWNARHHAGSAGID